MKVVEMFKNCETLLFRMPNGIGLMGAVPGRGKVTTRIFKYFFFAMNYSSGTIPNLRPGRIIYKVFNVMRMQFVAFI